MEILNDIVFHGFYILNLISLLVLAELIAKKKLKFVHILLWVAVVDFLAFLPATMYVYGIKGFFINFIYAFRILSANVSYTEFLADNYAILGHCCSKLLINILYVCSPPITGFTALSLFKDTFNSIYMKINCKNNVYIFTELNERSITLAKSIKESNNKYTALFLGKSKRIDSSLVEKCNQEGFLIIDCSADKAYNLASKKKDFQKRKVKLFFIDENETKALEKLISFMQDKIIGFEIPHKTDMFLFSALSEAEISVDSFKDVLPEEVVSLRLVDSAQLISYQMLMKYPLFTANRKSIKDNGFNITVIGIGNIGTHIAKDVAWCGQMRDVPLHINIIDIFPEREQRSIFEYKFPELSEEYGYNIKYYKANAVSAEFDNLICSDTSPVSTTNYFIVALGDDNLNVTVARDIRAKFYRKHKEFPIITAVIRDDEKYNAVKRVFSKLKINIIGNNSGIYSARLVFDDPIYKMAKECDNAYESLIEKDVLTTEANFLRKKETNIRSSIASAIHSHYKIWEMNKEDMYLIKTSDNIAEKECAVSKIIGWCDNMSDEDENELIKLENQRWNAFQRSEGWVSPFKTEATEEDYKNFRDENSANTRSGIDYEQISGKEKLQQNMFAKIHSCICDYDKLPQIGEVMCNDKDKFINNNRVMIGVMKSIWNKNL